MSDENPVSRRWPLPVAARRVRLSQASVRRYVRAGLVQPTIGPGQEALFDEANLARLRKMRRLSDDLGVNHAGIEIVMRLLDELELLRARQRP